MVPLRIAIIGLGKIAIDQHIPAIRANSRYALIAAASPNSVPPDDLHHYTDHRAMIVNEQLDAVAICTPPSVRYAIARDCVDAGLHTLLEKPPGVTLGEVAALGSLAAEKRVSLFTTWHAQYNPAVRAAAEFLAGKRVASMRIVWKEDVRKWHPGQQWIWQPGGFGIFDPGINALSIATRIFPGQLVLQKADLFFPSNRGAPIAAELVFSSPSADDSLTAQFDWRHSGDEEWTITITTSDGIELKLAEGGAKLTVAGDELQATGPGEYPALYTRFVDLIDSRQSWVDSQPLMLVADAFLSGTVHAVEPFDG
jgi:predicted dehydrogenase